MYSFSSKAIFPQGREQPLFVKRKIVKHRAESALDNNLKTKTSFEAPG